MQLCPEANTENTEAGGGFSPPGQGSAGGSLVQALQGAAVFLSTLFYLSMELGCAVHLS